MMPRRGSPACCRGPERRTPLNVLPLVLVTAPFRRVRARHVIGHFSRYLAMKELPGRASGSPGGTPPLRARLPHAPYETTQVSPRSSSARRSAGAFALAAATCRLRASS